VVEVGVGENNIKNGAKTPNGEKYITWFPRRTNYLKSPFFWVWGGVWLWGVVGGKNTNSSRLGKGGGNPLEPHESKRNLKKVRVEKIF